MKEELNIILHKYIIANIVLLLISSYLYTIGIITYLALSFELIIMALFNLLILVFTLINKRKNKEKIKIDIIDILSTSIIILGIISTIFAINRKVAIFGMDNRYEGLLVMIYYFTLLRLSKMVKDEHKKKIVYFILISGTIECIYAILQITNIGPVKRKLHDGIIWAIGLTNNPNFFGTYMLICLSYSIGLLTDSKKRKETVAYLLLIILFTIGVLIGNTLSSIVGLLAVFSILIIYCIKNKKLKKLLSIVLIIGLTTSTLHLCNMTTLIDDFIKTSNETKEIAKGNINEEYGTRRFFIWKKTLEIVPKNIIHGVGIDNFYYAFGKEPIKKYRDTYDKAHNEYLQILITQGIFSLISYLLLYAIIVFKGIINSFKKKQLFILLPVIGYLIQAFFNISVIEVAPIFYISLGLLVDDNQKNMIK